MKLGIIGTGKIVAEALQAIRPLRGISCNAIFARPHSREKAEAFAAQYAIDEVYTDYDALLDKADVDTVYIALINSVHFAYAKRALLKHKNVILEKPFTGTYEEAKALFSLAQERNLFLFEAITVLHNDVIRKMRETLPKLGNIRMMLANYSQYSSRYDRYLAGNVDPSFDPVQLGGALRDINVYNIHYAAALFGAPRRAQYYPNTGFNGVDTSGTLVLAYDGFSAVCTGAKDSDSPCFLVVQGENGYMRINGKPNVAPNLTTVTVLQGADSFVKDAAGATVRQTETEVFVPESSVHRMTAEFRDFAQIIAEDDHETADRLAAETLVVMQILSASLREDSQDL